MTMLWQKPSTAFTRLTSFTAWGHGAFKAAAFATLEWVDWFNNRRLLALIGNIRPVEAEESYYAIMEQSAMAG